MVRRALERVVPIQRNLSVRGLTHLRRGALMGRGIKDPWSPRVPPSGEGGPASPAGWRWSPPRSARSRGDNPGSGPSPT
jgi:hypothetical protein